MNDILFPDFIVDNYLFSSDKSKIPVEEVHQFLSHESYWAKRIPLDVVKRSIDNSICIGIYENAQKFAGFGRMITDRASFAYLADIFITNENRGKGLSKVMMKTFCTLADEFGLRRLLLTTQDAHGLYAQCGFEPFPWPERLMSRKGVIY